MSRVKAYDSRTEQPSPQQDHPHSTPQLLSEHFSQGEVARLKQISRLGGPDNRDLTGIITMRRLFPAPRWMVVETLLLRVYG
jgi:hypothetical protein